MRSKRKWSVAIVALLLVAAMNAPGAFCSGAGEKGNKILFAVAAPMTGDSAAMGIQIRKAAEIAVSEINASGGVKGRQLEMAVFDDQANPQQATIVAEKIAANKNILFVLGHNNSGCSISALPTYTRVGLPVISGTNTAPKLTTLGYKNYFRVCPDDSLQCAQQVLLGVQEFGLKKPAVIWENTDYGKSLRDLIFDAMAAKGIKMLGDESYVAGTDRDYSAQITKLKGMGVDSVYFMGEYTAGALFMKQSKGLGFESQVIGASGCSNPKIMEIAGSAAEGFYVITMFDPFDPRPKPAEFIKKYMDKYGDRPGEWGAHAYDVVYLVKKAIEMGATDRASLIGKLHEVKAFDGVTGTIEFDAKGDVPGKKIVVLKVENGKFVNYVPTKY